MKRLLVCGGRRFSDHETLVTVLDRVRDRIGVSVLIHGDSGIDENGARAMVGADKLAGRWARANGIPEIAEPADWDRYGDAAGRIRNNLMLKAHHPELVIAFHGNHGTAHMRRAARKKGIVVIDVTDGLGQTYREIEIVAAGQEAA